MLVLVYTFNFIDRQIVGILAVPIKTDLGLTDTQLGALTRTQIGPVQLGRLEVGEMRELSLDELGELMDSAQL